MVTKDEGMNRENIANVAKIVKILKKEKEFVVYGAGIVCKEFVSFLGADLRKKIISIVVTSKVGNDLTIEEKEVISIDEMNIETNVPIVIAVKEVFVSEILELLYKKGYNNVIILNPQKLMLYKLLTHLRNKERFLGEKGIVQESERDEKLYGTALNVGKFIGSIQDTSMCFPTLTFTWGGSRLLDYALIRGLITKYKFKTYLEIGTYIGDSLKAVSDLLDTCYSISVPETHPAHMKNWCKVRHINDYSNQLVTEKNMVQFLCDSKEFDYSSIDQNIDVYFIDGDHSYNGVLIDSIKVFDNFDPESNFVVWHDCRTPVGISREVVNAIEDAIGKYFNNFYVFDNCMCGIYIPDKYLNDFETMTESDELTTYKVVLSKN